MLIEYNSQEKQDSLSHVRFADEELIKTQVLQGEAAQTIIQGKNCSVYKMETRPERASSPDTRCSLGLNCSMTIFICPAGWRTGRTPGPTCWRSITAGLVGLSANFQTGARSIWERVIWPSMS